ncbi:MAG: SHOCT domain-containing protein [Hyphomicrobiales bacterium]
MTYGWYNHGMGAGWWALMIFGMVVFWAVVVVGLVMLMRYYRSGPGELGPRRGPGGPDSPTPSSSAVNILMERFAKGELTEEEFARRLALLKEQQ